MPTIATVLLEKLIGVPWLSCAPMKMELFNRPPVLSVEDVNAAPFLYAVRVLPVVLKMDHRPTAPEGFDTLGNEELLRS
jgi:hypothetical protein